MKPDPHESGERLPAFRKSVEVEAFWAGVNRCLESFEAGEGEPEAQGGRFPLIFLAGLPRSGTTLLSQLVSRFLPVGYINNLIAKFWLNPVVGIRLSQEVLGEDARRRIELRSSHGVTGEPWGPHEFGYYWRHWLRLDEAPTHRVPLEILEKIDQAALRRSLNGMAQAFQAPVAFKNIICGLQAGWLSRVRPGSLFVYISREPGAVRRSILRCRGERYGDPGIWWSLKPGDYERMRGLPTPEEQVEAQVAGGAREFEEELSKPGVQVHRLTYEGLCEDPGRELEGIAEACARLGVRMRLLGEVPALRARD